MLIGISKTRSIRVQVYYNGCTMSRDFSREHLLRNEQLLRDKNSRTKDGIKQYFRDDSAVKEEPLEFICECSALDCGGHVNLSINTYEEIHQHPDRFCVVPGHEILSIEKIVAQEADYYIVEKLKTD